jgi:hypothetical protein
MPFAARSLFIDASAEFGIAKPASLSKKKIAFSSASTHAKDYDATTPNAILPKVLP